MCDNKTLYTAALVEQLRYDEGSLEYQQLQALIKALENALEEEKENGQRSAESDC